MTSLDDRAERLLRELAPEVLGAVMRRFRDFAASEDAVQEALLAASQQWPREGLPENPRGWLIHVACRRVTDQVRSEAARRRREALVVSLVPPDEQLGLEELGFPTGDDSLVLLFMCCHPALSQASAIALTLRAVGGLSTAEIARAFLVPEATMAQRISRAKQTIKTSGVPFQMPTVEQRAQRLKAVLHVLYLVFSEGYATSTGTQVYRRDLASEAIRLTRMLHRVVPDDCEVQGLLALMLLTDARRGARTGPLGELIPLDEQDRSRWAQDEIAEGVAHITAALSRGRVGPFQVQASIAALHDEAARVEETDWAQIVALYDVLMQMSDNPMVRLNHAIAVAMVRGPAAGLALLEPLDSDARMAESHRLDAVRGHLFERAGEYERAVAHYQAAARRTTSVAERDYLMTRAARVRDFLS